ncbi:hypothetical protein, conserved [Plasmodium gonderi]|uniref:A-kinase anchor protein 7-like phosphoesterase domain-containing protein n=1 Tax=Plasmodium gonderi TaxID=77519 RepID=A0A1Y1JJN6_PLAGO|nr:hypothetical protein, conserved [Plasmodium gonderi]GAW81427.1 hypothetical protein, conserved [Plasmodium gonderi]
MNIRKGIFNFLTLQNTIVHRNYFRNFTQSSKQHMLREHNKMKNARANYFICIPLSSHKTVVEELVQVQNHVIGKYDMLKECAIEKNKFHISLLILHIKKSQLETSKEAFHDAMHEIKKITHQPISFDKLETFRNDVLYLGLKESSQNYIMNIITLLRNSFIRRGIQIVTNSRSAKDDAKKKILPNSLTEKANVTSSIINTSKDKEEHITPHLTIMKNSYVRKIYANRKPLIFPDYYADVNLSKLQNENVILNKIQFLEMDTDLSTLYYRVIAECDLP